MKWTDKQEKAITDRGHNLRVAAAAGSGKTAVLVERIKKLILEDKCPIDRMLIVTFKKGGYKPSEAPAGSASVGQYQHLPFVLYGSRQKVFLPDRM